MCVIGETFNLQNGSGDSVVMISFTGHATGKYFQGIVLGGATDTQIIGQYGDKHSLSAKCMLRGTDYAWQDCELYIQSHINGLQRLPVIPLYSLPKYSF